MIEEQWKAFENNDSREIVRWVVLDEDNQIVDTYDKIEDIEKEYK